MKLTKDKDEDFVTCASKINREYERFKEDELSQDRFQCLIFVKDLTSGNY